MQSFHTQSPYTYNPATLTNSSILWTTSPVFKIFISNSSSPNFIICLRLIIKSLLSAIFKIHFAQLSPHADAIYNVGCKVAVTKCVKQYIKWDERFHLLDNLRQFNKLIKSNLEDAYTREHFLPSVSDEIESLFEMFFKAFLTKLKDQINSFYCSCIYILL